MQPPIGDYGFLSDCHSAALVDRDGSVDWWCVPRFDSPSVFGRLLDQDAGSWSLAPTEAHRSARSNVGDGLVIETVFHTATGSVALTDALLLEDGARGHDLGRRSPHVLARTLRGVTGEVLVRSTLTPRMEYGRTTPHLEIVDGGVVARGGPVTLTLRTSAPVTVEGGSATCEVLLAPGEECEFRLAYAPSFGAEAPLRTGSLEDTNVAWESWTQLHTTYEGAYPDLVRRSSVILQGLTFAPSGAVLAAATTSLPEVMGGSSNWDYRYAWLRDLSLTIRALWLAACPDEPERLLRWLADTAGQVGDELVQIMYGPAGERDLTEKELPHLAGYRDSSPVRVGNAAWEQSQSDVFGEVLDAAYLLRDDIEEFDPPTCQLLVALADRAASTWEKPDAGMWEARDQQRDYTSSKVMCWVALDRAVKLAHRLGPDASPDRWATARDQVREAVLARAWSEEIGCYAGALDSDELDASVLVMPLVGFLPAADKRMRATIEAVAAGLGEHGLVRRWREDPSGFLICTYWLVECLALLGDKARANELFLLATGHANDLGLLAEEADPVTGELLGNFPQAFSHVGLINAAWRLGTSPTTEEGTT